MREGLSRGLSAVYGEIVVYIADPILARSVCIEYHRMSCDTRNKPDYSTTFSPSWITQD